MPALLADKFIVSNMSKLTQKYGVAVQQRLAAVKKLIAMDAARGIVDVLVDLSDAVGMAAFGVAPIPADSAGDEKLNKDAIDAIYTHGDIRPSYLMQLGSTDVIPHVSLVNLLDGDGDNSKQVVGDVT